VSTIIFFFTKKDS